MADIRTEAQAWAAIERFLLTHESARFELVPPVRGMHDKWRAYFKHRPWISAVATSDLEPNPPVGIGSQVYVAVENLLRFIEKREPIDD